MALPFDREYLDLLRAGGGLSSEPPLEVPGPQSLDVPEWRDVSHPDIEARVREEEAARYLEMLPGVVPDWAPPVALSRALMESESPLAQGAGQVMASGMGYFNPASHLQGALDEDYAEPYERLKAEGYRHHVEPFVNLAQQAPGMMGSAVPLGVIPDVKPPLEPTPEQEHALLTAAMLGGGHAAFSGARALGRRLRPPAPRPAPVAPRPPTRADKLYDMAADPRTPAHEAASARSMYERLTGEPGPVRPVEAPPAAYETLAAEPAAAAAPKSARVGMREAYAKARPEKFGERRPEGWDTEAELAQWRRTAYQDQPQIRPTGVESREIDRLAGMTLRHATAPSWGAPDALSAHRTVEGVPVASLEDIQASQALAEEARSGALGGLGTEGYHPGHRTHDPRLVASNWSDPAAKEAIKWPAVNFGNALQAFELKDAVPGADTSAEWMDLRLAKVELEQVIKRYPPDKIPYYDVGGQGSWWRDVREAGERAGRTQTEFMAPEEAKVQLERTTDRVFGWPKLSTDIDKLQTHLTAAVSRLESLEPGADEWAVLQAEAEVSDIGGQLKISHDRLEEWWEVQRQLRQEAANRQEAAKKPPKPLSQALGEAGKILQGAARKKPAAPGRPALRAAYEAGKPEPVAPEPPPPTQTPAQGTVDDWRTVYKPAGDVVDGRVVRDFVPNMASIESSLVDPEVLPGLYEVPMSEFAGALTGTHYSVSGTQRILSLADEIKASGELNPLIVAIDDQGPYILEGGHRIEALYRLGAKSIPAKVVIDRADVPSPPPPTQTPATKAPSARDPRLARFLSERVMVEKGDPRFGESRTESAGLGSVNVVDQASLAELVPTGTSLHHETSLGSVKSILRRVEAGPRGGSRIFVSDNPDLALGQGGGKYVLEFDPERVNGFKSKQKSSLEFSEASGLGTEFVIDKTLVGSLRSITAPNKRGVEALRKAFKGVEKRFDFDAIEQVERGLRIPRRGTSPPPPTQTPAFRRWFGEPAKGVSMKDLPRTPEGEPITAHHSGTFDETIDPTPEVGAEGMHFGTKAAAEERIAGKPVDDMIRGARYMEEADEAGNLRWWWRTDDGMDSFEFDSRGFSSAEEAKRDLQDRAVSFAEFDDMEWADDVPITEVYLNIKNPKRTTDHGADWTEAVAQAKAEGHDSIVYRNQYEDKGKDSYIIFHPTQAKSVKNVGTFGPTDPRTLYGIAGAAAAADED